MELADDLDLFWIAKEGLKAPLPENWKPCKTVDTDEIYYFNFSTGESQMLCDTSGHSDGPIPAPLEIHEFASMIRRSELSL